MKLKVYFLCFVVIAASLFVGCPNPVDQNPIDARQRVETPLVLDSYPEGAGGPVTILLLCDTEDVTFSYTTDGTMPSSSHGTTCNGVLYIYESCTLKVVAVKADMRDSEVVSNAFTIIKTAKPKFNYNSGDYPVALSVIITCGTPNSEIWYTTDGTIPSKTNGQKYSLPIAVNEPSELKAIAYRDGLTDSSTNSASYTFSFPFPIADDIWKAGFINAEKTQWFYFDAEAGERYEIKWDDSKQGSGGCTGDVKVTAYKQNQFDIYFYSIDGGYTIPKTITASATERVYIKVQGYNSYSDTGSYALKYRHLPSAQLSDNQWLNSTVSYGGEELWGYFDASAGEVYEIQWDDSKQGSSTYSCDIKLTTYRQNKTTTYFYAEDNGYSTPKMIKALADERIYIMVTGYDSSKTGTFAIKYRNVPPIHLDENQWANNSNTYASEETWYYFEATAGEKYEIKWDDKYQGSGTKTCDVQVSAYRQNKSTSYFSDADSGYNSPKIITAAATERVYVKAKGYLSSTGTFALRFRPITMTQLSNDQWQAGAISVGGDDVWYSFDAVAGTKYEIKWDDSAQGSAAYTCDVKVAAYRQDMFIWYFTNSDSGYTTPQIITAAENGKVYVKVSGCNTSVTGTYAVKFRKTIGPAINPYGGIQSGVTEAFAPDESWTFMVYLDADNNLEEAGIADFNEMISGLNGLDNPNVKVIVLIDRISGYSSEKLGEGADWTGARLYEMNQDGTFAKQTNGWFTDGSEINMGDPSTLSSFISYAKANYSSQHYSLILWNHGGGARSKPAGDQAVKAVCWDDTNSGDCLFLDELQQVVSSQFNVSNKLDFIGFDACLMGTVEVAYEFRELALVMAGSMANEWGNGWDYDAYFGGMAQGSNNDPKELGKLTVKMYRDSTQGQAAQTLAAIDLTQIGMIKPLIDSLAAVIYQENKKIDLEFLRDFVCHFYSNSDDSISYPYYDMCDLAYQIIGNASLFSATLVDAAQAAIDALGNIIIATYAGSDYGNYYGLGSAVKRGLSIFFSRGNLIYDSNSHYRYQWWYTNADTNAWNAGFYFGFIDFANSDADGVVETWRELMEAWYDPAPSNYTPGSW